MLDRVQHGERYAPPLPTPRAWRVRTVLGRLASIGALAIFLLLIAAVVLTRVPIFGYRTVIITGGSMERGIHTGSLLFSQRTEPERLRVGDIITFRYPQSGTTITHRIASVRNEGDVRLFTTKGDANQTPDADEISFATGRAYETKLEVPYAGYALWYLGSLPGIALIVGVPLLTLAAMRLADGAKRRRGVDDIPDSNR